MYLTVPEKSKWSDVSKKLKHYLGKYSCRNMFSLKTKINQLLLIISLLFIFSCENDPVSVDNSFADSNSFFMQSFDILLPVLYISGL